MKTLKDIRHLLNDNAIDFVDMWIAKHWDSEVIFTHQDCRNWITVCMPYEDIYGSKQKAVALVSLSTKVSGGAASTFWGDIKHFVNIAGANIAHRRQPRQDGMMCYNDWVNYEWCQRVRRWLKYRYNIVS